MRSVMWYGSLVGVDDVDLGHLVQCLLYSGVHFDGSSLVGGSTQLANQITHGLSVVTIVESSLLLLTDSLD